MCGCEVWRREWEKLKNAAVNSIVLARKTKEKHKKHVTGIVKLRKWNIVEYLGIPFTITNQIA
jgi:hypothetical protein